MRRLAIMCGIALVCSGCGTFRKVFKSKESHSVKVEQSSVTYTTTDRVDKSITTVTERIDTTITVPGKTVTGQVPLNMDSLVNGMTAIKNELIDVKLHLNPRTGILEAIATIKPVPVPISFDKTTTTQNNIAEQTNQNSATDTKVSTKDERSEVKKEPVKMGIWLLGLVIIVLAIYCVVNIRNKRI